MKASQIVDLLCTSSGHNGEPKRQITQNAAISEIITALQIAEDAHTRQILCDILGELRTREAVSVLLMCLDDVDIRVRSSAADSLAKIGDATAGPALFEHYLHIEKEPPVKRMLAAALGAVKYESAIPSLIRDLTDMDGSLRGTAAWSLGNLKAVEALQALNDALERETLSYARERMQEAVAIIEKHVDK